jgi:hypothetical protein
LLSHIRNTEQFIEPEGSLSCSQELLTGRYPQPVNPIHIFHHPISPRLILILLSHLCLNIRSGLFLSGFPTETFSSHTWYMPCQSHPVNFIFLIISDEEHRLIKIPNFNILKFSEKKAISTHTKRDLLKFMPFPHTKDIFVKACLQQKQKQKKKA